MRKHLRAYLVLLFFVCVCPCMTYASNETYQTWNGTDATAIVLADEIEVHSAADLAGIAALSASESFAGKTIRLKANIDLGMKAWQPIGTATMPFQGVFEGEGHLIRGIRTFSGTNDGVGLFGFVGQNAQIKQIGISGGLIMAKNKRRIGAIAGVCDGAIIECWSMAEIVASGNVTGGLVGELTANGVLTDCYQSGLIYHASDTVGAIVGRNAGTLTRVYSSGYAANDGNAIVGTDAAGNYNECYFDRKAYLQKTGIIGNAISPIDSTALMFSLFGGYAAWQLSEDRYPMLSVFAATDAAALSVAPMFLNTTAVNPVEHANDVTLPFTVSITDGITWTCQKTSDEQWIQIDNMTGDVQVVRPCAPTEVLVNSQLRDETRVVYMSPRRVEDMLTGVFVGKDPAEDTLNYVHYFCFNSYEPMDDDVFMRPAERGWLGDGDYHYTVLRYAVNGADTVVIDTMLWDVNTNVYYHWYDTCKIPTNEAGHFFIRSFVHDNGCSTDWRENPTGLEYFVFGEFIPGTIVTKRDTIILDPAPVMVGTSGSTASVGGAGEIWYMWYVNGDSIPTQKGLELVAYPITKAGKYTFTRATGDEQCYTPDYSLELMGVYTVVAFNPIDPGEVTNRETQRFCTVAEAKQYTVTATKATGSAGIIEYQWYMDGNLITGATSKDLKLNNLNLQAGHDYTFTRKVQDDTRFTTWKDTRYSKTIHIMANLTPGAIENAELPNYCFAADATRNTTATIQINEVTAATCDDGLEYKWIREPDKAVVGTEKDLNYTFPLREISLGRTYVYQRWVRNTNPDCDWVQSAGEVSQYYGQSTRTEVTKTICKERLPYTLTHTDGAGNQTQHTFTHDGEEWEVSDTTGACPADTVFIIRTADVPVFTMDTAAHVCQETGTMTLEYKQLEGMSNTFRITFSPDMAVFMGRQDTVGTITRPGLIILKNMPPIGKGNCYLELEIGYSGTGTTDEVCYSTPSKMSVEFSLGGYLHTKYDRVLFVDNNPYNGLETGGADKLKFVAYQWYKDGQKLDGETKQYYHQNGASLSGIFYVIMTAENGKDYRSCEVTLPTGAASPAPQRTNVYPVPVGADQPLTIECEGSARIISFAGEQVMNVEQVNGKVTVSAPRLPGIYFVQITGEDGMVEMHKLIVK